MSKFNKRQIALTMAFASLLGGKSSALDKSLDYNAIGNQKLNANNKVSGKISAGKILAFLIPAVVVGAVATNEIFNKKYNIRNFYKKYIAKSNDETTNEDKPKDDNKEEEAKNDEIADNGDNINKIGENEIIKNSNINNIVNNEEKSNNNLKMESKIKFQTNAIENNIRKALGGWCETCFAAFKKACDNKNIESEEDMLRIAKGFSKVADKLSKEKAFDKNFTALFNLFKSKNKVNSIEILNFAANNEKFTITVSHQVFTIEFKEEKEFRIRVNEDASGELSSTTITLSFN